MEHYIARTSSLGLAKTSYTQNIVFEGNLLEISREEADLSQEASEEVLHNEDLDSASSSV